MKRFKDIVLGSREPQYHDVLWIDTSTGDNVLKVFNSGWKELSPSDSEYEQLKQELLDQMEETATKVTNNIVAGAPEAMDTLKEVSDTILSNKNKVDYELNDIKSSVNRKLDNSTTLNEIKIKFNKDGTIVPNELEPVETDVVYRQGGTTLAVTELNLSDNMKIYRTMPIKIVPHKYLLENNAGSDYVNIMTNNLTYNDVLIGYYCDDKGNYMHNDNEDKLLATNITKTSDPSIVINNTTDEYIYAVLYIVGNSAEALPHRVNIATNNAEKLKQASTDAAAALSGLDKKQDKAVLYSSQDEMEADQSKEAGTLGCVDVLADNELSIYDSDMGSSIFDGKLCFNDSKYFDYEKTNTIEGKHKIAHNEDNTKYLYINKPDKNAKDLIFTVEDASGNIEQTVTQSWDDDGESAYNGDNSPLFTFEDSWTTYDEDDSSTPLSKPIDFLYSPYATNSYDIYVYRGLDEDGVPDWRKISNSLDRDDAYNTFATTDTTNDIKYSIKWLDSKFTEDVGSKSQPIYLERGTFKAVTSVGDIPLFLSGNVDNGRLQELYITHLDDGEASFVGTMNAIANRNFGGVILRGIGRNKNSMFYLSGGTYIPIGDIDHKAYTLADVTGYTLEFTHITDEGVIYTLIWKCGEHDNSSDTDRFTIKTTTTLLKQPEASGVVLDDGSTITFDELKTKLGIQS